MQIIDGKKVAAQIKEELKNEILPLRNAGKRVPGLVAILVGDNPASQIYVNSKNRACNEIGMLSKVERLEEGVSEEVLLDCIKKYNQDRDYHGILVQLPLPPQIDQDKIIDGVAPEKDVDGFHPVNVGKLVIGRGAFYPCTPLGIIELLHRYKIETKGKHVVVVGRSNIVGKPVANLLLQKKEGANAVVTICHSAAVDLLQFTKQADILIAAIGRAAFIKEEMVKEGTVVIDVGMNRVEDKSSPKGYKLVGDVDFESVSKKASFITPVPGGVGPMTIAMLLKNTYQAFLEIEKNS